jgi:hypothetical protein
MDIFPALPSSLSEATSLKLRQFIELTVASDSSGGSEDSESSESSESSENSESSESSESKEACDSALLGSLLAVDPAPSEWGPLLSTAGDVKGLLGVGAR